MWPWREQRDVAVRGVGAGDHAVDARGGVGERLAAGRAVASTGPSPGRSARISAVVRPS